MKKKDKIIKTAVQLFNKDGVSNISTNHIAKNLKISPGNLYYHFRSKEDIIRSIFKVMSTEFDRVWSFSDKENLFNQIINVMSKLIEFNFEYRFFYNDMSSILRNDSTLKEDYNCLRIKRQKELKEMFIFLTDKGFFQEKLINQLDDVVDQIWFITEFWLTFKTIKEEEIKRKTVLEAIHFMFQVLSYYYTEKGRKIYNRLREEL